MASLAAAAVAVAVAAGGSEAKEAGADGAVALTAVIPFLFGCRDPGVFVAGRTLGEGTFGVVTIGTDPDGSRVALKKVKMDAETEGFPVWALREIKALRALKHDNIVHLREVATSRPVNRERVPAVFMVFDAADGDLEGLMGLTRDAAVGDTCAGASSRRFVRQ